MSAATIRRSIVIVAAFLASSLQMLDTTITVVSLPQISASLNAAEAEVSWIVTAYLLGTAMILPMSGWLAGMFGRRLVLIVALLGFAASSALCGANHDITLMSGMRFLQGCFGAPLGPLCQTLIADNTTVENRSHVMSRWLGVMMIVPALGPPIGGFITGTFSWPWVFYINVPVCLISAFGMSFGGDAIRRLPTARFDAVGFTLLTSSIVLAQFVLDRGQLQGWFDSRVILIAALISVVAGAAYVTLHRLGRVTYVPSAILMDANYRMGAVLLFLSGAALYGPMVITPIFLSDLRYSAGLIGLLMAPRGLVSMILMVGFGKRLAELDMRIPLVGGFLVVAASLYLPTIVVGSRIEVEAFALASVLQGVGFGLLFVVASILPFMTLPAELRAQASGFSNLSRFIGGAVGVAAAQTFAVMLQIGSTESLDGADRTNVSGTIATFLIFALALLVAAIVTLIIKPRYANASAQRR